MMKIDELLDRSGMSQVELARQLGVTHQVIQGWKRGGIPPRRVLAVEAATGIHRSKIRPDIYPPRKRRT